MLNFETFEKIYKMLDEVSPLEYDCGSLCGSACCSREAFTDGDCYIYLLPGEKEFLESKGCTLDIAREAANDHYLPASWGEYVYTAGCFGPEKCDRSLRPIQCRTFPMQPHFDRDGELEMIFCNIDIPYECPLIRGWPKISESFVKTLRDVWDLLIKDGAVRDLVELDSSD